MQDNSRKKILTAGLLLAVLLTIAARQNNWDVRRHVTRLFAPAAAESPEDTVYRMLDAARVGDTQRYLDCFAGTIRAQIGQVEKESSQDRLRQYLTKQSKLFTGVAVSVVDGSRARDKARLRLEYVFPERNEVQELYLEREAGEWRIDKVMGSEQITTLIPYGTAVTD